MLELRFMLRDEDETEVGYTSCPACPRAGETIWLQNTTTFIREHGGEQMRAFRVLEVAYWMNNAGGGFSIPSGTVAVFVEPVI